MLLKCEDRMEIGRVAGELSKIQSKSKEKDETVVAHKDMLLHG